jgi:hypothetical protein
MLSRETMKRVLDIIREEVGDGKLEVDTPTQNLESYFLSVVERAKQSETTSGATSGHRVAAYLRGEAEGPSAAERVLERLTLPDKKPEPQQVAAAAPTEKIDSAKLDALVEAGKEPTPSPRVETPPPEDVLEKADKKLSDLLGDKS